MVHISCTWQNNDSSSSPTVITCNCSKAIYWGRGGTQGVSARKTVIGEGVFWEPLLTRWQKRELVRAGVPVPSTDRGGRELLLLPGHEGKQRRCQQGLGEGEGRLCHPTGKETAACHAGGKQPPVQTPRCSQGCARSRPSQSPQKLGGTLLINY